jgi:hypothetical protein
MGVLDLPAPLFQLLDGWVAFLPATLRLILWSVIGAVLSMLLYALMSPQKKISGVKAALRESQKLLADSDESFAELMTVARRTLSLSFQHLGLVFGPALLSSFPLLCIMAWSSTHFGHDFPEPGEHITVTVQPESAAASLRWQDNGGDEPTPIDNGWTIRWPGESRSLILTDTGNAALLELPLDAPIPQVHKRLWWNSLLGNPAGYLPEQAPVERVWIDLPGKRYLPFGPGWLGHWLTLFLLASVIGALITKKIFRIH